MAFHDVRFPERLAVGASGGPERRTEIVTLATGHEARNAPWADSRRRYDAGVGLASLDDLARVVDFFEARRGQLHSFRWKDPLDFKSGKPSEDVAPVDQEIGTGDGSTRVFQLRKRYGFGPNVYDREISKPVEGTVRLSLDATEQVEGADFTVDHLTGEVSFLLPPAAGLSVGAGFEFDVPVRFDTDRIEASLAALDAGEIPSIPVVEVRQ